MTELDEKSAEEQVESGKKWVNFHHNIVTHFVNKQRAKLSSLQEADLERGERQLVQLLGTEEERKNHFPVPGIFIGILIWVFIIFFPLMMILDPAESVYNPVNIHSAVKFYAPLLSTMLVFLMNQRLLVPKFFFRKKYGLYLAFNTLLMFFVLLVRESVSFLMTRSPNQGIAYFFNDYAFSQGRDHTIWGILTFMVFVGIVCLCCILISVFTRQIIRAFIMREKKRSTIEYELNFLKQQLSPHFLFNTLNNISSLISIDPKLAESSMTKLSHLLRVMLYQTGDKFISLKEDTEILQKYAELEKLRLDDDFDFVFDVKLENPHRQIEPLMLMPLMENAMKHCINPKGRSFAHISISQQGDELRFKSENGNFPRKSQNKAGGFGLSAFKKRLELAYDGRYTYETRVEGDVYICELRITLK